MTTIPLTMEDVLALVKKGIDEGKYLAVIDLLVQFAGAAVNEVERLMKNDDMIDLQSRLAGNEKLVQDLIKVLTEYNEVYKGLCMIYGLSPETSPVYAKSLALVNANKKEI